MTNIKINAIHAYWYKNLFKLAVYRFIGSLEGTPHVRARRFVAAFLLRITHGLRSGGDKRRLRGYGGLGHYATLHSHARLRPHFCAAGNLRFPLSRRKNAANLDVMWNVLYNISGTVNKGVL
jgi:hypothetical protein